MNRRPTGGTSAALALAMASVLGASGCGGQPEGATADGDQRGVAAFQLTQVPPDTACLRMTAAGARDVVRKLDVTAGQSTVFSMTGLPTGAVTFSADAFSEACAGVDVQRC